MQRTELVQTMQIGRFSAMPKTIVIAMLGVALVATVAVDVNGAPAQRSATSAATYDVAGKTQLHVPRSPVTTVPATTTTGAPVVVPAVATTPSPVKLTSHAVAKPVAKPVVVVKTPVPAKPAAPVVAPTRTAQSVPLGDYAGWVNPSGIASFGSATGTHPSLAADYLDRTHGWSGMDSGGGQGGWHSSGLRLVLGVPIIPGGSGGTLAAGATGAYDAYFATLAQNLVSQGEGNAILRLGWEFNGTWYPWSVANNSDAQNFASFWRQIVNTMRAVPGQQFAFLWNPNAGGSATWDLTQAYPGSAYVDYIGTDVYDEYWGTPKTPQNSWNNLVNETWGLKWLAGFAASEGRPIAMPEWSVTIRSDGYGMGDDPYFVTQFAAWVASNNVAFTDMFSFNDTAGGQDNDITNGNFPNALAAFKVAFG